MTLNIKIPNAKTAEKLNKIATEIDETIFVHSNDGLIMVDARSLIGLFALVGEDCHLVAEDNADPKILSMIAKKAGL